MGGKNTYNKAQMISGSEVRQLADFYAKNDNKLEKSTVQYLYGKALFCSTAEKYYTSYKYCIPFDFKQSVSHFTSKVKQTDYGHTSVRMDFYYIIVEQRNKIFVQQIYGTAADSPVTDLLTIPAENDLSSQFGCAVQFTDYSFLYIGGIGAVEINLITYKHTMLEAKLNHEREKAGCAVVEIDGVETVLVAGGIDSDAKGTSEYYDKTSKTWKLTKGSLNFPR